VALGDLDNARVPIETTLDSVGSWDYLGITNEWQHVKIPLSALMPDDRVVPLGSCIYSNDGIAPIPPGILAEGPNQHQGWRYSRFFGRCYANTNSNWTVSEHAIYYNANLVYVLAMAEATALIPAF
jgi:hypothetical protein